jgi:D-threo-aldose 1-dehydrogenase
MRQVSLPASRSTSALGFGSGFLSAQLEMSRSLSLVQAALDEGIRHFDTAPLYGDGCAENVLGKALRAHRGECTIATKVGIARPTSSLLRSLLRLGSSPLRRAIRRLRPAPNRVADGTQARGTLFAPDFVCASLAESLRRLQTTQVDLLLLHEAQLGDLNDDLMATLEQRRRLGDFAALGLATEPADIRAIAQAYPGAFDVFQHHWCVLDARDHRQEPGTFRITHRALMRALAPIKQWLQADVSARQRLSQAVAADLADEDRLAAILIAAASSQNADGIILVASHSRSRIRQNAHIVGDSATLLAGKALLQSLLLEPGCPFYDGVGRRAAQGPQAIR